MHHKQHPPDHCTCEEEQDAFEDAILGLPPKDFEANIKAANAITEYLQEWELDYSKTVSIDALMIAAVSWYVSRNEFKLDAPNVSGWLFRARQIVNWLTNVSQADFDARAARLDALIADGKSILDDHELRANKTAEIARQVSIRCSRDEAFFLLLFKRNRPGWVMATSDVDRESQIKLLELHLERLKEQHAKQQRLDS